MKYFIFQGNDHDCGFAALKILLANFSKNKSYLYIKKKDKKEQFSIKNLQDEAANYGFQLGAYKCDDDYYNRIVVPSITIINKNHAVVIKKITKKRIVYLNPEVGLVKLKKDEFFAIWEKYVLEIEAKIEDVKLPKIRREILPNKLKITELISAFLSTGILVATFYLLNNEKNTVFSLIFLLLFATTQIIENMVINKEINFFDNQYIRPYFSNEQNQDKLGYIEFIGFKQKYFTNSRGVLSSGLTALMVSFLLIMNDFRNIFVLLAMILLKVLELFLFSKHFENNKKKITEYEYQCMNNKKMAVEYAEKANSLANVIASQNSMKSIIYIAIVFAFALGMMFLTGSSGCNYVIFHFGLYYIGFHSFSQIIIALSNRKEDYKEECRFFDRCDL